MDSTPGTTQPKGSLLVAVLVLAVIVAVPLCVLTAVVMYARGVNEGDGGKVVAAKEGAGEAQPKEAVVVASSSAPAATEPDSTQREKSSQAQAAAAAPPAAVVASDQPPPSVIKEPASPASPAPPWQSAIHGQGRPWPYTDIAFEPFDASKDVVTKEELEQWFEPGPAGGFRVSSLTTQFGQCGAIEGTGRLKSPWPDDGVLRLQLENFNRLKMHFFHELAGVTLIYYEEQNYGWAAYATTRDEGKATPKTSAITATDDERCRRTELRRGGPIELRYRAGKLILSRGDIVLLAAPLAGPPSDVFFEGRATFQGIELVRAAGGPELPRPGTTTADIQRPAELTWTATQPEIAKPELLPDGGVSLAADNAKSRAECFLPLPKAGLHEVILQLDDITPGAGVYLGRENGVVHEVLRFQRDRRTGQLGARLCGADNEADADFDSPGDGPTPLVQPKCWVKLLYGCGNLRWWLSSDGAHWAQTEPAQDNAPPKITSIGSQLVAGRAETHLTLRRVMLRRLDGLSSLADDSLVQRAPALNDTASLDQWLERAVREQPAEVNRADWLRACTVRSLAAGTKRELAYPLLEALLDDAASRGVSVERQLAALDDAMLLCLDLRDGQAMRVGIPRRFAELGIRSADESADGKPAWTTVRGHYHAAPIVTKLQSPANLDRVIRWELVQAIHQSEPSRALEFLRRLRFFHQDRDRPLVDWVDSVARRETGADAGVAALARPKESWRHPLVEELNKDAYNVLTELKSVLEGQAWEDAARLLTSHVPAATSGVAPVFNDKAHLVSLPVAIQLAQDDYPQLRQILGEQFAALAKLRIGEAIAAGEAAGVEMVTVQFAGTEAAAQAFRWLADQSLTGGSFARALNQYERAQQTDPSQAAEIAPRIRLAGAMLGRDVGSPATASVQFGEVSLSATEFESLITEMRTRERLSESPILPESQPPKVPAPSGFSVHVRSRLDGPVGDRPQEEVSRRTNQHRAASVDRQIATAVEGDALYVSNRFQVARYDLNNGLRTWQGQPPPGQMQRAQEWPMIPMRPLVVGKRVFARMLYSPNPVLVSMEKSSGKLLWAAENRDREFIVSDPLIVQGQLVALAISLQQEQQGLLKWCVFDPQTGELLKQRELLRLRNTWSARACCEVAAHEEGLIANLGGITLATDGQGGVRWIRAHVALPADEDPQWALQMYHRPLVSGERVYVAQPGVRTVDCLAIATGRRVWSIVLPEVVGIVGLSRNTLVVRTETAVRGLDAATGAARWRYAADEQYDFPIVDDERLLLASRERASNPAGGWRVRLTWINSATGEATATTELSELADVDPRLGPMVPYKDRLFAFFGRGQQDPTRDIVELVPRGDAQPMPLHANAWQRLTMRTVAP